MLFDEMNDYGNVKLSYNRIVAIEIAYRGLSISAEDVLKDKIKGCLCIASRRLYDNKDYEYHKDGISRIKNHFFGGKFSADIVGALAGRVLYLASSMLMGKDSVKKIDDAHIYSAKKYHCRRLKCFHIYDLLIPWLMATFWKQENC